MDLPRLNKFLASCGVASRRACDELILKGQVEVNGQICMNPATRVREADFVKVEGRRIQMKQTTTLAFHKPRGFVCTREDELNRATIYEMIAPNLRHLHHVGRLDLDSEGLLILTNDGQLTQQLMHPSKSVEKEYYVTANQAFESRHLDQFLVGIYTPEGKLTAKAIERMSPRRVKVVLEHGAKRQIRVMFDALGYHVTKLLRVRIGSLWLGDLAAGEMQALRAEEVEMLLKNPKPSAKMQTLEAVKDRVEAAKKAAIRERQEREAELESRERRRDLRERETRYGREQRVGRGNFSRDGGEREPRREVRGEKRVGGERGPRESRDSRDGGEREPRREVRGEKRMGGERGARDSRELREPREPRGEQRRGSGERGGTGAKGGKFSSKKREGNFDKTPPAPRKKSRPRTTQKAKRSYKRH